MCERIINHRTWYHLNVAKECFNGHESEYSTRSVCECRVAEYVGWFSGENTVKHDKGRIVHLDERLSLTSGQHNLNKVTYPSYVCDEDTCNTSYILIKELCVEEVAYTKQV